MRIMLPLWFRRIIGVFLIGNAAYIAAKLVYFLYISVIWCICVLYDILY